MLSQADLTINVIKIFTLGSFGFLVAFLATPFLTHFLYKYKLWRKEVRTKALDGGEVPVFQKYHTEGETHVPRFGGLLIWVPTLLLSFLFFFLGQTDIFILQKFNFLTRSQTWLPLFTLVSASILGLVDDILQVLPVSSCLKCHFKHGWANYIAGGLNLKLRIALVALIGLVGGWWFYSRLSWSTVHIPGNGDIEIGALMILFYTLVMLATYSGGVIDGLDGLAGGVFGAMFAAFSVIALFNGQIDLAAFCSVIVGTILAFLWFNIPPARFYFGETGILGLTATLTVVAFLTNSVLVLPIIGFLLVIESGSVILQLLSKKFLHKKIFLAAPIHYHFEAKGWPHYKITMRFWVIGVVMAIVGVTIRLLG